MKVWAKMVLFAGALFLMGPSLTRAVADDDFSKEVVEATALTPSLYFLKGAGGNMTASIGRDGALLVDDDFAPMAEKILAKLKELKGGAPRFIVNTHFHYDHTGGNEIFGRTATIIAASEVRQRLISEQVLWHQTHSAIPRQGLPVITFRNSLEMHLNDDTVRVVHLPHGHTDGDSVIFFEKGKVVCLGDLYFAGMYPIFHPEHQGSLNGYIHNLEVVLKQIPDDAQVIPGHGAPGKKSDLLQYYQMIKDSMETVKKGIDAGLTLAQIQKAGISPKWESYRHGYRNTDQWIESIDSALRRR